MKDLNQAFSAVCKHKDFISDFHTPAGTQYLITDPVILQLVASQFRNEENGLFSVPENERLFIDIIAKDLYPEETAAITDREKELVSAILFTAESAHVPHLRASLLGFLKQKAVQEYKGEIDKIARELIDSLTDEAKLSCDSSALVFEFAISVICKLFMGYEGSREKYGKIVRALVSIGKRISDSILHQTQTHEEKKEYQTALSTIRELIQCNIDSGGPLPAGLKEKGFSPIASKLYLFFFYLAGTETTSAVTHYLLLQLGRRENWHYQK